ncbi:MAG TPA: TonB-dependent receptor, partial [Vicinamibacteria bacterium]|nr:TonB-dependent receptor [Vicinamibacteria bacterium]
KSGKQPLTLSVKAGQTFTDQGVGESVNDGELIDTAASYGFEVGRGWVSAVVQFNDRGKTNRAAPDLRDQLAPGDGGRNAVPQPNHWVGDPEARDVMAFLNAQFPLGDSSTNFVYAFGGWSDRDATAPGFYRPGMDARNHRTIYPLGFLPLIDTNVGDLSAAVGVRGIRSGWYWDLSAEFGRNEMDFGVSNSLNASLGPTIPPNQTEFYAGTYRADMFVANLDFSREVEIGVAGPVNMAVGAEFRREGYGITAGEPNSYIDGGFPNQLGGRAAPGAQVFPGLRPSNEVDESRSSVAGYVDFEGDVVSRLRLGIAGRVEDYSDFGSTADGKFTARLEAHPRVVVRGSAATGFRAPSLAQSWFSATSTNFLNLGAGLVPVEVGTFPVSSPQARALGSKDLEPEQSTHLSAGLVLNPTDGLDITADFYRVDIDDRIVFSGNFTGQRITDLLSAFGASSARFFTNAIDTRTTGWDVTASYRRSIAEATQLLLTAGFNRNESRITDRAATPPQLAGFENVLFDREQERRIQCGQPKNSFRLGGDLIRKAFTATARTSRFGEYCLPQNNAANDQEFSAKWITDVEVGYRFDKLSLAVGGQNVFDVYPEQQLPQNALGTADGRMPAVIRYAGVTPFGINGRFLYARATVRF